MLWMVYKAYAVYMDNYELSTGFHILISIYSKVKSKQVKKKYSNFHTDRYILPQHVYRLWRVATKILPDFSDFLYLEVYSALK